MEKPDFYNESLRVYPNNITEKYLWNGPHKVGINPKWHRSQDETETFARCRQEGCDHVWNTHVLPLHEELKSTVDEKWEVISDADKTIKQLQADNKLLREEIERLKASVVVTIEEIPGKLDV